ncbi:MAG: hypothetical protein ACLU0O_05860 [Collinsella sp.]
MAAAFSHVIFDLDGTILNTLEDLAAAGPYLRDARLAYVCRGRVPLQGRKRHAQAGRALYAASTRQRSHV